MLTMHLSLVAGPPMAGLLAAAGGLKFCYLVDVVSFAASCTRRSGCRPMPPDGGRATVGLRAVGGGPAVHRAPQGGLGALLSDLSATVLAMPFALFPAINADRFGGDPKTLGPAHRRRWRPAGSSARRCPDRSRTVHRPGWRCRLCAVVWGVGLIGFGLVDGLTLTLGCLVVAGVGDVLAVVFRTSVIQLAGARTTCGAGRPAAGVRGRRGRAAVGQLPGRRPRLGHHRRLPARRSAG
jgi:hypothetical protein